jgi:predicted MarR family transcription regulator
MQHTMNQPGIPQEADFLPSGASQDLSSFEFALITLMFGFQSWVQDCMDAAGFRGLSPMDILVLHAVNHRARDHRQADICRVLNIDDAHLVAYALKKLLAAGLVSAQASGRERRFTTTPEGEAACLAYRRVREDHLVPSLAWVAGRDGALRDAAGLMGTLTALYAQAGRGATASTAGQARPPRLHTKR